jgi:hypothetical protein
VMCTGLVWRSLESNMESRCPVNLSRSCNIGLFPKHEYVGRRKMSQICKRFGSINGC